MIRRRRRLSNVPRNGQRRNSIEMLEPRVLLASIPIRNAGFERPVVVGGPPIPYWNVLASETAEVQATVEVAAEQDEGTVAFDGEQVAVIEVESVVPSVVATATLAQNLDATVQPNTAYALQTIINSTEVGGTYKVQIRGGGILLAEKSGAISTDPLNPVTATATFSTGDNPAQLGQQLQVRLITSTQNNGTIAQATFDHVIMGEVPISNADGPDDGPPVYSIDVELDGVLEPQEMNSGASVAVNADFDEGNRNSSATWVDDTQPNFETHTFGGHRTASSDEELRFGTLQMAAPRNPDGSNRRGRWRINLPPGMKMWQWWDRANENVPYPHWGLVVGDDPALSLLDGMNVLYQYRLEGVFASTNPRDVVVTAYVEPYQSAGLPASDQAVVTVTPAATVPDAPINLQANGNGSGSIALSWSAPLTGPTPTGYDIYRSTQTNFVPSQGVHLGSNRPGTTFVDDGLEPSTTYYYLVTSRFGGADSRPSNESFAIADIDAAAPRALTATAVSSHEIDLSWLTPTVGSPISYRVYRSDNPNVAVGTANILADSVTTLAFVDLFVVPGVQYYYKVTAVNAVGAESGPSNEAIAVPFPVSPEDWGIKAYRSPLDGFDQDIIIPDDVEETVGDFLPFNIDNRQENLSKVVLKKRQDNSTYTLSRSAGDINVWADPNKSTPILAPNSAQNSATIPFASDTVTVWLEWGSLSTAPVFLNLIANDGVRVPEADQLMANRAKREVIIFAGHTQSAQDNVQVPKPDAGVWDYARLLVSGGYHVKIYSEDPENNFGWGQNVLDGRKCGDGVNNAFDYLQTTRVANETREVALIGYSHGGGSVYALAEKLKDPNQTIPYRIEFTAYLDGVRLPTAAEAATGFIQPHPEERNPPHSVYHVSYYQSNHPLSYFQKLWTATTG